MIRKTDILTGQLYNFILFSFGVDIDEKGYFDSKIYQDDFFYDYKTIYEWGYDSIDRKVLVRFLDGK